MSTSKLQGQAKPGAEKPAAYYSIERTLEREAGDPDPGGINRYSNDLIKMVVPERAGEEYRQALAIRLAAAERIARSGKGSLVRDTDVIAAYNRLMKQIGTPHSFYAVRPDLAKYRLSKSNRDSGRLFTSKENGDLCEPGEAFYLLFLLISRNGKLAIDQPSSGRGSVEQPQGEIVTTSSPMRDHAQGRLTLYSLQHEPSATQKVFDEVVRQLHF